MKVSADVFLSNHGNLGGGIDYSGRGLKGTPAEIVANLQALNATRTLVKGEVVETVYHTPDFKALPDSPDAHDDKNVQKHSKLVTAAEDAEKTGDLEKVRAAADKVNALRMVMGGIHEYVPFSDFIILSKANNAVGVAARYIQEQRARWEQVQYENSATPEEAMPLMHGSPVPWFDTPEAFKALNDF